MDLLGKTAMVTGAGRGIGKAIALALAEEGADIVATGRNIASLNSLRDELNSKGRACLPVKMDVARWHDVEAAVSSAVSRFGSIDILVNNAGVLKSSLLVDLEEDDWDAVCDINVKGTWLCTKAVARLMRPRGWGRVINLSSRASQRPEYGNGVYCVSKAAVDMLTQCWALELAPYNITVNAICPGYIETEMFQDVMETRAPIAGVAPVEFKDALVANVPLKRTGKPSEIGELAAFLASDKSAYITGETVIISGGL